MAKAAGADDPVTTARDLVGTVIEKNLALISNLVATLDPDAPVGAMLTEACGYQARIFERVGAAVS